MTPADAPTNYFSLFQLDPVFALDLDQLDSGYKAFQGLYHPDKTAHLDANAKRQSLHWATLANEAYRTLKKPIERARYLLQLNHVMVREDDNTATDTAFLLEQMEWREELHEAVNSGDIKQLSSLEARVNNQLDGLTEQVAKLIDLDHRYQSAAELVRRMRFLDKLTRDITEAFDALES